MTVDLNIDPVYIVERIRWYLGMPYRDVVDIVIKEYKTARNLRPVKMVVLGPPASGKTRVARYLADHYGIHYVHVKTLISDRIQKLVSAYLFAERPIVINTHSVYNDQYNKISDHDSKIDDIEAAEADTGRQDDLRDTAESANGDEDEGAQGREVEDKKEAIVSSAKLQEQLDEIRSNMAANNGRLDDIILNK